MSQCTACPPNLHGERSGRVCGGKGRESEKARHEVRKEGSGSMRDVGRE